MTRMASGQRHRVSFTLNGSAVAGEVEPRTLLTDFLRHQIGATGTHVGCEHGVCGACTVIVDGMMTRACLTLAVQIDGSDVRTVEGLKHVPAKWNPVRRQGHASTEESTAFPVVDIGSLREPGSHSEPISTGNAVAPAADRLGVLQAAFKRHHALQCGFCTAGILMSLDRHLADHPAPDEHEIRDLLSGHLCRCTGYTPIVRAALDAAAELAERASNTESTDA